MSEATLTNGYNARLFSGGFRRWYHLLRFHWLRQESASLMPPLRVIELGCFDGRSIDYLPPLDRYVGIDANWDGGLDDARRRLADRRDVTLVESRSPDVFDGLADKSFNLAISLETLEHIDPAMLDDYLKGLARVLDGRLLVSVPNEIGAFFLAKYLVKGAIHRDNDVYRPGEVWNAFLGRTEKVERREHKGFNYRHLVKQLAQYFEIVAVDGVPGPKWLSGTIGIIARTRR
jgi:SAM-dependent methyltransferase